ncbi:MAG: glycosyl hydrolase [Candidatus Saccharibacteria bacterium]
MKTKRINFLVSLLFLFSILVNGQSQLKETDFRTPPESVKVNTWWHWISGEITREGITKDLESMKQQGIVQATILNVGGLNSKRAGVPNIVFDTPEWHEMFKWALKEADRLNIKIGVHNCDGWSTSGGPWISPDQSMKQFVWSQSTIDGGKKISVKLSQPIGINNYYRDVAVVAYPAEEAVNSFHQSSPHMELNKASVETLLTDGNPKTEVNLKTGDELIIKLTSDILVDKIVLLPHLVFTWDDMSKIKNKYVLSASTDGNVYNKIADLEFTGVNKPLEATFPAVKARYFRVTCISGGSPVAEMELLKQEEHAAYSPSISFLIEKTASVNALNEKDYNRSAINQKGIAQNSVIDLSGQMADDGTLTWKAPKGKWQVIRFGYTTTGIKNGPATPEGTGLEVDKMDTAALNFHFSNFAGRLLKSAGYCTGNTFKFLLIDSWECQFQTWTKAFPEEFNSRRGYSIIPWIPVLCGQTVENTNVSEAFLHDFRKTIADLIDQNYYSHFGQLCHRNKLEMHAEIIYANSGPYPPIDAIKSNRYPDLVMTEFWASPNANQFPQYEPAERPTPGFPTYASLACNKPIIGSEAYTGYAHYSESPFDLKPFGDAAFCYGINQIILHSYVHQPTDQKPGITLGQFAAHFNRNNPWWEYTQDWMNYQARVQYVLQQGEPIAEALFFVGDQLPEYFGKSIVNELPYGYQAAACNFDMLKNKAKVVDGKITFGGTQSYPVLALPKSQAMEFATLQRLAELVNQGAVIYGPKPTEMISNADIKNHSAEFTKLSNDLWGTSTENNYGKGKVISAKPIAEVLKQLDIMPAIANNSNNAKEIMYIHKKIGDTDVYYLFNQQKNELNRELTFRVTGKTPEIWDAENGVVTRPAIYTTDNQRMRLPFNFKPYESKIIVFKNNAPAHFIQNVSLSGKQIFPSQPGSSANDIPQAVYRQGKFEFSSDIKGDYSFTTNDNRTVKASLMQPRVAELENMKTTVEFYPITSEVIQPVELKALKSLTEFEDTAIKYFAGKAKYTITFNANDNLISSKDSTLLNLGSFDATAKVVLNGQLLAYAWVPNASLQVKGLLRKDNILEITVADVCRNRFIGDLNQYGAVKSLWTTSPIESILKKEMPLKPSGLIGPLKLISYSKHWE